ncbi:MAG: SprB repeat-containing protein [Bacteroidetes bacterium]|nr:SprB repeat-containing protein [Bacteroidota bacterium]
MLNSFGTCYGNTNGSMVAVISGGMPPYTYAWSTVPVQTNATATGLTNGVSYYVQVTDANGCSTVFGNYLSVTSQLFIVNNYSYNNCVDYSNTVSSQNGTAPFTFLWNTIPRKQTKPQLVCNITLSIIVRLPMQMVVLVGRNQINGLRPLAELIFKEPYLAMKTKIVFMIETIFH